MLTKSAYLIGRQCPLRLWLRQGAHPEPPSSDPEVDALSQLEADRVEQLAARLFPGAVAAPSHREIGQLPAAQRTSAILDQGLPVLQGCLSTDDLLAIPDVLVPTARGLELWEVKASTAKSDGRVPPLFDHDLAFQVEVARRAGHRVVRAGLILLDPAFVLPEGGEVDADALLQRVDRTAEVAGLEASIRAEIHAFQGIAARPDAPDELPSSRCREDRKAASGNRPSTCGHFDHAGRCGAELPSDWAGFLPRLAGAKARLCIGSPGVRIADLDADDVSLKWTDEQARVIRATQAGAPEVDPPALRAALDQITWPVTYLDFEFDTTRGVPVHPGASPYDPIPFQWSVRIEPAPGEGLAEPHDWLHAAATDPRRAFAESLLAVIPGTGTLVAHHADAEIRVIRNLADRLGGDLADRLLALEPRFADTERIAKAGYYHPDQRGSYSLKRLAPALVGEGYGHLQIGNGLLAVARWRELIELDPALESAAALREDLVAYCGHDTELMHGILESLRALAAQGAGA